VAESDILNPTRAWWRDINDNPNPSYGTPRRTSNNNALVRTRLGAPYTRETLNQGFGFEFYFIDRPWTTMLRLQHFYQQFKGGYFTYVDWDGGGRHHVGRFTTAPNATQTANGKYTVQSLVFEEVPGARMLQYPADFFNWSRTINIVDDFLNPAVSGYPALSTTPAWVAQLNPAYVPAAMRVGTNPAAYEFYNSGPAVGDYAQIQYIGWGFQMQFRADNTFGQVVVYVDGVAAIAIDLGNLAQLTGSGYPTMPTGMTFAGGLLTHTHMPLDMHRVKVMANGAAPSHGGVGCIFPPVKVIV